MKPSRFLLQASIFILIAFSATPSEANGKELKNWLDSAKEVSVIIEPSVQNSYTVEAADVSEHVLEIKQIKQITLAKCVNQNDLTAFYGSSDYCTIDAQLSSSTNYLPWVPDKASFVLLDHSKWGIWYFTARLSGCDVWIADREGGYEPLTIHINANKLANNPVKNLEYKQNLAMLALDLFNQKYKQQYTFIQRISYDYASDPDTSPEEKEQINEYWNTFLVDTNIPYVLYPTDQGFFYGIYDTGTFTGTWYFVLKNLDSGKILLKINCSVEQSSCTIQ